MSFMGALTGLRPIDTNGWDTVSAVKIGEMNAAIATAGTSPKSFNVEPMENTSASGAFGDWSIGPGGDGHLINLHVPLRDVSVMVNGAVTDLPPEKPLTAQVRVRLELLPSGRKQLATESVGGVETEERLLVIKTDLDEEIMALEGPAAKVATVLQVDGLQDLSITTQAMLNMCLDIWFNDNLHVFTHVFATVNVAKISRADTSGAFDWLKMTHVAYAYGHNAAQPEEGVLAVLGQTAGRSADGLIHQAQAEIIPPGNEAAICISKSRFLRDMIAKALPGSFKGLKAKDIAFKSRDTGLRIKKAVQLEDIEHDKKTYSPLMERMDIMLRDTEMVIDSQTRTEVSPGIFAMNSSQGTYAFGLTKNENDQKTIGYKEVKPMTQQEWTEKSLAVTILQTVLGVIAAIAGIAAIVLSAGTATVPALIAAGILIGAAGGSLAIGLIEKMNEGNGPPIDLLLANATGSVIWSSGRRFDPTMVALNGGLQMGGNFTEERKPLSNAFGAEAPRVTYQKEFQAQFAELMAARAPKS